MDLTALYYDWLNAIQSGATPTNSNGQKNWGQSLISMMQALVLPLTLTLSRKGRATVFPVKRTEPFQGATGSDVSSSHSE